MRTDAASCAHTPPAGVRWRRPNYPAQLFPELRAQPRDLPVTSLVENKMNSTREMLFENATDFFSLEGSVWMRLSPTAAVEICMTAATHGRIVARIEGGIWHSPGFEARLDCTWDGAYPPISENELTNQGKMPPSFREFEVR